MKKDKYFGMSPRIARWKIDNAIENWLSYRADSSAFWKKMYVSYYRLFDNAYYLGGLKYLQGIVNQTLKLDKGMDPDAVMTDMIYCLHRFGISFQDYCIYDFLHHPLLSYRTSFVPDKLRYHYCDLLNAPEVSKLMTDKFACYQRYKPFFKRDMVGCFTADDQEPFLGFLARHDRFIYKPLNEHSGHGIEIFQTSEIDVMEFFSSKLPAGPFVLEELIQQGKETARMHPQSVNSCRVVTFFLKGEVHVLAATWRIGSGNSIKDNAGSGGMYAAIDVETGQVQTDAINYRGAHFETHPDTGVRIPGYQLPAWDEAMQLVQDMVRRVKGTTLVSWDIAFSTKGWLMVEANENGDWSIVQSNKKVGRKADLYALMDQYMVESKGSSCPKNP